MAGDIAENNLGLSDFNMQLLRNEVSIVFFSAALLKMVAPLKEAVNVNTKGLLRALDIALEMKQLLVNIKSFILKLLIALPTVLLPMKKFHF